MVNVGGQPSGRSRETITRQIQAAELVSVNQKCNLRLRIPGLLATMFRRIITVSQFSLSICLSKVSKKSKITHFGSSYVR